MMTEISIEESMESWDRNLDRRIHRVMVAETSINEVHGAMMVETSIEESMES